MTKVLAARRESEGPEHSDTLASMNSLALLYQAQQRYNDAEPMLREAVSIYEKSAPNDWRRFYAQAMLGDGRRIAVPVAPALSGRYRHCDAPSRLKPSSHSRAGGSDSVSDTKSKLEMSTRYFTGCRLTMISSNTATLGGVCTQ